jgi:uncharacterized lipoprotein
MNMSIRARTSPLAALAVLAALAGCASSPDEARPARDDGDRRLFGLLGDDDRAETGEIGVNSFLWRASLDTLSFMPLASADPYGGVITTDWYADPRQPTERFKATVYILDTRLRADGVKVSLNKERLTANGWTTADSDPDTAIQIENAILTRARQLKLSTLGG